MLTTIRDASLWYPLLVAAGLTAAVILLSPGTPLYAVLGVVTREVVTRVRDDLMCEVERLRCHGLSADTACRYTADKLGLHGDSLVTAHFHWLLERWTGEEEQPTEENLHENA